MTPVHITKRSSTIGVGALLPAAAAACLYASTLMSAISGCAHEYCADVGEFQVALPLWGTVHYTGYPLYMLLGSPFVTVLHVFGISPALGASIYSLVWETLAVAGLVILLRRFFNASIWLAGGIGLLFAVIEPIWVHGVLAEVYSLSMVLSVAILYLAIALRRNWSDKRGWLLAFLCGAGIAHHRLLGLHVIPVGMYLLPILPRSRSVYRWLVVAALCFAAGFLPYLDIPLRIELGSTWNYDQANTWQGFWRIFWGTEVAGLQQPGIALSALLSAAKDIVRVLVSDFTLPGIVIIGFIGARAMWSRQTRSVTWFIVGVGISYVLFALLFHDAVLLQATLMVAILALCLLLGIGFSSLSLVWQKTGAILCFGWAVWLMINNWGFVASLTSNQKGVAYMATAERLEAPDGSIVMAPWGPDYFALAYAQRVEGRMAQWLIVDHRADFGDLMARASHSVYTHMNTLYVFGPDWWTAKLGSPLRIVSAGPAMVMLTAESLERPTTGGVFLGDQIILDHWEIRSLSQESLDIILYWAAMDTPTADYSTSVQVSDQEVVSRPEDLIAVSDSYAPVYGWNPTSHWLPNEVIREDHVIQIPPGRSLKSVHVGMYIQDSSGNFHELGPRIILRQENGQWVVDPRREP